MPWISYTKKKIMQVYLRVSVRGDKTTFSTQKEECTQFVRDHLQFAGNVSYTQEVCSAYSRAPRKLRKLIYETLNSGDTLVVKRADRFSRNRYIGKTLLDKALDNNVTVHFAHEKISVRSRESQNYETILGKFSEAQKESEKIGARIKKAADARLRRSIAEWKKSVDRTHTYSLLEKFISACRDKKPDVEEVNETFRGLFDEDNPPVPLEFVDGVGSDNERLVNRLRRPMTYTNIVDILESYEVPFVGGGSWTASKARSIYVGKKLSKRTASTTLESSVRKHASKKIPVRESVEEDVDAMDTDDEWNEIEQEMARLKLYDSCDE